MRDEISADAQEDPSSSLLKRLKRAGVWVRHDQYASAEPPGYTRDNAPFEAADLIAMQAREIKQLRSALARATTPAEPPSPPPGGLRT